MKKWTKEEHDKFETGCVKYTPIFSIFFIALLILASMCAYSCKQAEYMTKYKTYRKAAEKNILGENGLILWDTWYHDFVVHKGLHPEAAIDSTVNTYVKYFLHTRPLK